MVSAVRTLAAGTVLSLAAVAAIASQIRAGGVPAPVGPASAGLLPGAGRRAVRERPGAVRPGRVHLRRVHLRSGLAARAPP